MFLLIPVRVPNDPLWTSIWKKILFMRIATKWFFFVSKEVLLRLNPAMTICPLKDGYVCTQFVSPDLCFFLISSGTVLILSSHASQRSMC